MIEFLKEPHLYLKNGILVKSVTQILQLMFPDKYKGINRNILENKARFGTLGHSIIENLDVSNIENAKVIVLEKYEKKEINQNLFICLREYIRLIVEHEIEPIMHEQLVSYKYLFCGTLDMIANVKGRRCLCDIKFTSELDIEYLSWQLSMYELAIGERFEKLYCIWLPTRELAKLVEIPRKSKEKIINKLKELGIYE